MEKLKEPMIFINTWRILNLCILIHLWIISESNIDSFSLILLLCIITSLRLRFDLSSWWTLAEVFICLLFSPYTLVSHYGLVIPIFELALKGKWKFSLLILVSLFFSLTVSPYLFWYFISGLFFGTFSFVMLELQKTYKLETDQQRKARYELEKIKIELLDINEHSSHQAEITERYRISRELHDHLGHDLTGALLGLKAYEYIKDSEEAKKLMQEVKNRLEKSTKSLRDIVHNMTPNTSIGVERLEDIIVKFNYINIDFKKSGDMTLVPAYKWNLLEVCLKEALTNIVRHSNCTEAFIDLSVIKSIVRLSVKDNGTIKKNNLPGSGLRNLQMRARFLGGSLTFMSREDEFLLVCVIPLVKEDLTNETFNSR